MKAFHGYIHQLDLHGLLPKLAITYITFPYSKSMNERNKKMDHTQSLTGGEDDDEDNNHQDTKGMKKKIE